MVQARWARVLLQVVAIAGQSVFLHDTSEEARTRGMNAIKNSLERLLKKESLTEDDKAQALSRITLSGDLEQVKEAEVIIEAVFESISVKEELWQQIDSYAEETALLASNTSSLSITQLASFTSRPERFCGLHFFNPVPVLPLVEVVRGLETSDCYFRRSKSFCQ